MCGPSITLILHIIREFSNFVNGNTYIHCLPILRIQDGGLTAYWSLENAIYDSNIIVGKDSGSYTQQWIFEGIA